MPASSNKLRAVLLIGFGGLLSIMLFAGLGALRTLWELQAAEENVRQQLLTRTQALSTVILTVHSYSNGVEQVLLAGTVDQSDSVRKVSNRAAEAHSALKNYPDDREPQEQLLLQIVESQLAEEEAEFRPALFWTPGERRKRVPSFLAEQVIPRQLRILEISSQIARINSERFGEANRKLLAGTAELRKRLAHMLISALSAGLVLSLASAVYISRLERQAQQRYQELANSRRDLEQLSARLVDAQEEERRSISRELHDEVGQSLGALLVDLGRLSKLIPPEQRSLHDQLSQIKGLAENTLRNVRNIALLLRPSMLDDLGLEAALEWQAREVSRRSNLEVDVHCEGTFEHLSDEHKICIYRVVQEALTNAANHASPKNVQVVLVKAPQKITISVADNGHGFDARHVRGMGLLGMSERIRRLGGTLLIHSEPGEGTTLTAELPLTKGHENNSRAAG